MERRTGVTALFKFCGILITLAILAFTLSSCKSEVVAPQDEPFLNGYWGSDISFSGLEFYLHLIQKSSEVEGEGIWSSELVMNEIKGLYTDKDLSLSFNMPYTNLGPIYWTMSAKWYEEEQCFKGELVGNTPTTSMRYVIKLRRSDKAYLFKRHNQGSGS